MIYNRDPSERKQKYEAKKQDDETFQSKKKKRHSLFSVNDDEFGIVVQFFAWFVEQHQSVFFQTTSFAWTGENVGVLCGGGCFGSF